MMTYTKALEAIADLDRGGERRQEIYIKRIGKTLFEEFCLTGKIKCGNGPSDGRLVPTCALTDSARKIIGPSAPNPKFIRRLKRANDYLERQGFKL